MRVLFLAILFAAVGPLIPDAWSDYRLVGSEQRRALRYSERREVAKPGLTDVVLPVYFRFGSSTLDDDDRASIVEFVKQWGKRCAAHAVLESFTDERGSARVNRRLAEARGESVATVLSEASAGSIITKIHPVGPTKAARFANARRVDVIMTGCREN
jgi:outer membrane protein OmpA-like peptidoglycan-associated protein